MCASREHRRAMLAILMAPMRRWRYMQFSNGTWDLLSAGATPTVRRRRAYAAATASATQIIASGCAVSVRDGVGARPISARIRRGAEG